MADDVPRRQVKGVQYCWRYLFKVAKKKVKRLLRDASRVNGETLLDLE